MNWRNRISLPVPLISLALITLALAGCGGGSSAAPPPPPPPPAETLSVTPQMITVDAGSATTFTGVFAPTAPTGGSLTWSITPVDGGTITGTGVLTASATAGAYAVEAIWTPAIPSNAAAVKGSAPISIESGILRGSATVTVLAVPQLDSVISPDQVQASGANQTGGAIQNGVVVGQEIPSVLSIDSGGNIEVFSSFPLPAACPGSTTICQ